MESALFECSETGAIADCRRAGEACAAWPHARFVALRFEAFESKIVFTGQEQYVEFECQKENGGFQNETESYTLSYLTKKIACHC